VGVVKLGDTPACLLVVLFLCMQCMQHTFLSGKGHLDILYQLVHRTQEAVRLMDNQSFKRLQKMLMHGGTSLEEDEKEEIESEPPRWDHWFYHVFSSRWSSVCLPPS